MDHFDIIDSGEIGNMRYELREYGDIECVYEVVVFACAMGLTVCANSSKIACEAFVAGMKAGKCRNIGSIANKNLLYSEFGSNN